MRRTTICRSSRGGALALLAVPLLVGVLRAQDTTHVDTTRHADTTRIQDTTQLAGQAGQLPPTHVVSRGETLWSISQLYFGDPLLWPEIYRQNTAVVEDPHWIYPGEVLTIGEIAPTAVAQAPVDTGAATVPQGAAADTVKADTVAADTTRGDTVAVAPVDTTQAAPEPPPPEPEPESYRTIFDRSRTRTDEIRDILRAYANQPYRPLRRGEFYSAGWLTEQEQLPWGAVLGTTSKPSIYRLSDRTTAAQFEEISIRPPRQASYHVGDSLLLARIDRDMPSWGDVVVPVGVARVTAIQPQQVLAQVILEFSRVHDGQLALPLEPFKDPGEVRPTPVAQGLEGHLIASRDEHALSGSQQIFFIDKGRADGVTPGDVFQVYRPASGELGSASEEPVMQMMIVHTREHSASGLIIQLSRADARPGLPVRLVKKMPS
jgi:LysM domain-containing protein